MFEIILATSENNAKVKKKHIYSVIRFIYSWKVHEKFK